MVITKFPGVSVYKFDKSKHQIEISACDGGAIVRGLDLDGLFDSYGSEMLFDGWYVPTSRLDEVKDFISSLRRNIPKTLETQSVNIILKHYKLKEIYQDKLLPSKIILVLMRAKYGKDFPRWYR